MVLLKTRSFATTVLDAAGKKLARQLYTTGILLKKQRAAVMRRISERHST